MIWEASLSFLFMILEICDLRTISDLIIIKKSVDYHTRMIKIPPIVVSSLR